jgi:multidrug efflux pump subunit AcrA (membrane-fusion protein)
MRTIRQDGLPVIAAEVPQSESSPRRKARAVVGVAARAAAMLVMLVVAAACGSGAPAGPGKDAGGTNVTLAPTVIQPADELVVVTGTLMGDEEVTIAAKVGGRVVRVAKEAGDRAAFGEVLAEIDPTDYALAATQAKLEWKQSLAKLGMEETPPEKFDVTGLPAVQSAKLIETNAASKLKKGGELYAQKPPLLSEQDYLDLKAAHDGAQKALDLAVVNANATVAEARAKYAALQGKEKALADASVCAPTADESAASAIATKERMKHEGPRFAVAQRMVSVGAYVAPGAALFRLVADDPLKFRATVPERFLSKITEGKRATVSVESADAAIPGTVSRVIRQVNSASRAFEIEITLVNADGKLAAGSFAKGAVVVGTDPKATFVPMDAVQSYIGVKKVFTVEDGKAVEHIVRTGAVSGRLVQILEGLSGAQMVIVTGGSKLSNGSLVMVKEAAEVAGTAKTADKEEPKTGLPKSDKSATSGGEGRKPE